MKRWNFFVGLSLVLFSQMGAASDTQKQIKNFDANNCEFYVDSFRTEFNNQAGLEREIATAVIVIHPDVEKNLVYERLTAVGNWVQFVENGELKTEFNRQNVEGEYDPLVNYSFRSPFVVRTSYLNENQVVTTERREIKSFAYFVEVVDAEDEVRRLWLSNNGLNFSWEETLSDIAVREIPYGFRKKVVKNKPLFWAKDLCQDSVLSALSQY